MALGSIAFQTPEETDHETAASDAEFQLVCNETMVLKDPEHLSRIVVVCFHRSLRGLNAGAPVEFEGINVGEIKPIDIHYGEKCHEFVLLVMATLYPTRFGMDVCDDNPQHTAEGVRTQFDAPMKNGIRTQLKGTGLLTEQQSVNLDFIDTIEHKKTLPHFSIRDHDGAYVFPMVNNSTDDIET